jgi:hypothetical protein
MYEMKSTNKIIYYDKLYKEINKKFTLQKSMFCHTYSGETYLLPNKEEGIGHYHCFYNSELDFFNKCVNDKIFCFLNIKNNNWLLRKIANYILEEYHVKNKEYKKIL